MKIIKNISQLICFLFLFNGLAVGQTVKAVVVDAESHQAIPDVFVFLDNSSTGAITDMQGVFTLKIPADQNIELVFSHLNYELLSLSLEAGATISDTIFLEASGVILDEAVVTSKAKPRVRSRWLKRFRNEFLGLDYDKKLIRLVNPDVLLFEQNKGVLKASSKEALIIENKLLGYRVQFFLTAFESYNTDGDLRYHGKVFFEPMEGTKKEKARYKRNRSKAYKQSSRSFFAALGQQKATDLANYEVGYAIFNKVGEIVNYERMSIDTLQVKEVRKDIYEIAINRILTITNNQSKIKQDRVRHMGATLEGRVGNFKQTSNNIPRSYMWSKKGRIVINKYGTILNPLDLEEAGYWSSLRVAALLPLDYKGRTRAKL